MLNTENDKLRLEELENKARALIVEGYYRDAFFAMFMPILTYKKMTGLEYTYNVMWKSDPIPFKDGDWYQYVQGPSVRTALHVGQRRWSRMEEVFVRMESDIPVSVAPWLTSLLDANQYRVLLYSGQLDGMVAYQGTLNVAKALRWTGAAWFGNASHTAWMEPECWQCNTNVLAGYATTYGPLTVLLVRNAGHMVPYDQPAWAHSMIERFTSGKPFH